MYFRWVALSNVKKNKASVHYFLYVTRTRKFDYVLRILHFSATHFF